MYPKRDVIQSDVLHIKGIHGQCVNAFVFSAISWTAGLQGSDGDSFPNTRSTDAGGLAGRTESLGQNAALFDDDIFQGALAVHLKG